MKEKGRQIDALAQIDDRVGSIVNAHKLWKDSILCLCIRARKKQSKNDSGSRSH